MKFPLPRHNKNTRPPAEPAPVKEPPRKTPKPQKRAKPAKPPKPPGMFAGKPLGVKLLIGFASLFVLALSTVIAAVVIGTQIGFYQDSLENPTIDKLGDLDLTVFTPIATEGVVWAFTFMSVALVLVNRTSKLWTRSMWGFALVAAFVNGIHAVWQGDLLGGMVTGGLSLAGPYVVHCYIHWVRHILYGSTIAEATVASADRWKNVADRCKTVAGVIANHVVHPLVALQTISVWCGVHEYTYAQAWHLSATAYRRKLRRRLIRKAAGRWFWANVTAEELASVQRTGHAPETVQPTVQHGVHGEGVHDPETVQHDRAADTVQRADDTVQHDRADPDLHTPEDRAVTDALHTLNGVHGVDDLLHAWTVQDRADPTVHAPDQETVQDERAHPATSDDDRAADTVQDPVHGGVQHGVHNPTARPDDRALHAPESVQHDRADDDAARSDDRAADRADPTVQRADETVQDTVHGTAARSGKRATARRARSRKTVQKETAARPGKRAAGDAARPDETVQHDRADDRADDPTETVPGGAQAIAARYYWELRHRGEDPRAKSVQERADELGMYRTQVSKGFKRAEKGEFPDPGPDAFQ